MLKYHNQNHDPWLILQQVNLKFQNWKLVDVSFKEKLKNELSNFNDKWYTVEIKIFISFINLIRNEMF
ncbi:spiroplasma phage ORF1-like family protein [Spiroplasma poulsonii]|uniref:spiroplasma phage ORF1-like family protein n=1 Tax=Spiroplasma poulsonii TaxID=2138 RepID=UPI001F4C5DE5|nr:DUF3688 family protein [Spiroplasma poulsonii]UNF61539.1 DUF3688 family protein [Spiroplasma poulsonii]